MTLKQINGVQNRCLFEHNKTLGTSYALYMLSKKGPFFTAIHTILWEASFSDSENKITIWYKYLLLLDKVFSELFGTNSNPQFFKIWKLVWRFSLFTH